MVASMSAANLTLPDNFDLAAKLQALKGAAVLAMGDVMLDRFIYGQVERISPEAPIPVLRVERESTMLGGAGNVLRNIAALGAAPRFVTVIGKDAAGWEVQSLAGSELGDVCHLLIDPSATTTIKDRYIANGQQMLRADRDCLGPPKLAIQQTLQQMAKNYLGEVRALILSDYGKGVLNPNILHELVGAARKAGVPVIVDPKGRDFSIYRGAAFITPNRRELSDATNLPVGSDEEVEAACRKVIESCGIDAVLATRSEAGMTLVRKDGLVVHLQAEAQEVFDVSGAGDTVVATFGTALAAGLEAEAAARLANIAAGVVVAKQGTAVAYPSELLRAAQVERLLSHENKILETDGAVKKVRAWQAAGLTVGFTNGCFDLLHPGHLSLLEQCAAVCDRLIIGLNGDASVKRLKGQSRPIQDQAARAAVLASLATVDRVVLFDQDTPRELLEQLRPDVLVKGADYTVDQVVGADLVQGYGGKVILADLKNGYSTTDTIARLTN
jgi:D-beta-D-heptose 7-phosphate kinase/D-beta-D-heptose 1-phosphate adenosyltransferase